MWYIVGAMTLIAMTCSIMAFSIKMQHFATCHYADRRGAMTLSAMTCSIMAFSIKNAAFWHVSLCGLSWRHGAMLTSQNLNADKLMPLHLCTKVINNKGTRLLMFDTRWRHRSLIFYAGKVKTKCHDCLQQQRK